MLQHFRFEDRHIIGGVRAAIHELMLLGGEKPEQRSLGEGVALPRHHCARHLGWEFKRLKGDPTLLRDLVEGVWDESRYLVVPPGTEIRMGPDAQLTSESIK